MRVLATRSCVAGVARSCPVCEASEVAMHVELLASFRGVRFMGATTKKSPTETLLLAGLGVAGGLRDIREGHLCEFASRPGVSVKPAPWAVGDSCDRSRGNYLGTLGKGDRRIRRCRCSRDAVRRVRYSSEVQQPQEPTALRSGRVSRPRNRYGPH